jgi:outer membrane murein-binding lipoprotein Lpp
MVRISFNILVWFTILVVAALLFVGCGQSRTIDRRTPPNPEMDKLRTIVMELQGTVAQIDAFTENDFSDCSSNLPEFEKKICQIAQTATAEQRLEYAAQLADMAKIFQTELYGEDCIDTVEVGCPATGSITDIIDDNDTSVSQLQSDVLTLQSDIASLEARLDNFNGSGNSVEIVISGIESDVTTIDARVTALENTINNNTVFKAIALCRDIAASGPMYETVLMNGDRLSVTAYIKTGTKSGLGVVKDYNDGEGDLYLTTSLNSKNCKFKIYETTANSDLNICWNNANRNASEASIDTECDSTNDFTSPTADCTCK